MCPACRGIVAANRSCYACGRHGELKPAELRAYHEWFPAALKLDETLRNFDDSSSAPEPSTDRNVPG